MSSHKYHVTVEDCVDREDNQKQIDGNDNNTKEEKSSSRGSKRQASWEEIDALEEQARSEKIQNESTAMANATETARIVKEAQQSFSGF